MTDPETGGPALDPEQAEMLALCRKFEERYNAYFMENPQAEWVAFGVGTEELIAGGPDAEYPDEAGWQELEHTAGQELHVFGKPVQLDSI